MILFGIPFAPTYSHPLAAYSSVEKDVSEIAKGSEQAKPPSSASSTYLSCRCSHKWTIQCYVGACCLAHLGWWVSTWALSFLSAPFFLFTKGHQGGPHCVLTNFLWRAVGNLILRLCLYSVLGWPHPLGDKKMCVFESKDLKMQSRCTLVIP